MSKYYGNVTLSRIIEEMLEKNGYFSDSKTVDAAVDYIETYNSTSEDILTPEEWFEVTKSEYPNIIVHKGRFYEKMITSLKKQRDDCFDQTGCLPDIWDYSEYMRSDDWKEQFGTDIGLSELFNYLMDYYLTEVNYE